MAVVEAFPTEGSVYVQAQSALATQLTALTSWQYSWQRGVWRGLLSLLFESKGHSVQLPPSFTTRTWLANAPFGYFEPVDSQIENPALTLQNKPAWLMGPPSHCHSLLFDWFYEPDWWTSPLCSATVFFDLTSDQWTPQERMMIQFIRYNSMSIALWVYFRPICRMVSKCRATAIASSIHSSDI